VLKQHFQSNGKNLIPSRRPSQKVKVLKLVS